MNVYDVTRNEAESYLKEQITSGTKWGNKIIGKINDMMEKGKEAWDTWMKTQPWKNDQSVLRHVAEKQFRFIQVIDDNYLIKAGVGKGLFS